MVFVESLAKNSRTPTGYVRGYVSEKVLSWCEIEVAFQDRLVGTELYSNTFANILNWQSSIIEF